jgi:hypothetical protein
MGSSLPAKFIKRLTIVLVLVGFVVIAAVVIGIVLPFTRTGRESNERTAAAEREGAQFGKTIEQKACINEGLTRGNKLGALDLQAQLENEYFVDGCLKASQPTPGFCDGVPSGWKNVFADWDKKQCEHINMSELICRPIYNRQIEFCDHAR